MTGEHRTVCGIQPYTSQRHTVTGMSVTVTAVPRTLYGTVRGNIRPYDRILRGVTGPILFNISPQFVAVPAPRRRPRLREIYDHAPVQYSHPNSSKAISPLPAKTPVNRTHRRCTMNACADDRLDLLSKGARCHARRRCGGRRA